MSLVVVGSVRGGAGATTAALLLAGAREGAILVEADLGGGVLAVRYQLGREPGLTSLAAAGAVGPSMLRDHLQVAGGIEVLLGPDAPESSESLWARAGQRLAGVVMAIEGPVVADAGRLSPRTPLLREADLVVLMVRPVAEHLIGLAHRIHTLRADLSPGPRLGVVLVGDGPYRARDVAGPLEVEVLGAFPEDRHAAVVLRDGGRAAALARTRLARAAVDLADRIDARLTSAVPDGVEVAR